MTDQNPIRDFVFILVDYYRRHGRSDMLWRQPEMDGRYDPYKILVSELMLQQTQVGRVTPKFAMFISIFPDVESLAAAQLGHVLQLWTGLGYNRRAKFLRQSAIYVVHNCGGQIPSNYQELLRLPGVGPNTAGAILAYAYNLPSIYVETNIRTVIIHHFFPNRSGIADSDIRHIMKDIIGQLDQLSPREFYWALMDYGAYLKATVGNLNTASKSYSKQSAFDGSRRQLRGKIIRLLSVRSYTFAEIMMQLGDVRTGDVLADLESEQLILRDDNILMLA